MQIGLLRKGTVVKQVRDTQNVRRPTRCPLGTGRASNQAAGAAARSLSAALGAVRERHAAAPDPFRGQWARSAFTMVRASRLRPAGDGWLSQTDGATTMRSPAAHVSPL